MRAQPVLPRHPEPLRDSFPKRPTATHSVTAGISSSSFRLGAVRSLLVALVGIRTVEAGHVRPGVDDLPYGGAIGASPASTDKCGCIPIGPSMRLTRICSASCCTRLQLVAPGRPEGPLGLAQTMHTRRDRHDPVHGTRDAAGLRHVTHLATLPSLDLEPSLEKELVV
jgi:hypothetical protein